MEDQPNRDAIVDEAIGQTHGTAPPESVREKERISPEEAARRIALAPGADASIPEKTAASIGERVGDAYADAETDRQRRRDEVAPLAETTPTLLESVADRVLSAGCKAAKSVSEQLSDHRLASLVAGFGLGFFAAVLLQGRRKREPVAGSGSPGRFSA